uniref:Translocating chain-associated membrane protein n=1 Tax=Schistocephalus solidus TaxID=70667 RepID=A0A0X3Q1X9_SCHSO
MRPLRKKNKNSSYFSHEFIIENHGDIVSVVAMVFIVGMLFKGTAPAASLFISMQHNESVEKTSGPPDLLYTTGRYDFCAIFFYSIVAIILHAVAQEYMLDKITRKLHLPRSSQSKFSESGQLLIFYVASVYWAVYALINEGFLSSLGGLWAEYPHAHLPFWIKLFFIFQISYWLHNYPELYFQKAKKSEIPNRVFYSTLYLVGVTAAYFLNFTKLGIVLLIIHYTTDSFYHFARMMKFYGWSLGAKIGFSIFNGLYIPSRVICTVLAFLTFYYGLPQYSVPTMSVSEGNFNTWLIRLNCMLFVLFTQAQMVWTFVNYQLSKIRKQKEQQMINSMYTTNADLQKRRDKKKGKREEDSRESPDAHSSDVHQRKRK